MKTGKKEKKVNSNEMIHEQRVSRRGKYHGGNFKMQNDVVKNL